MSIISLVFSNPVKTKIVGSTTDGNPITLEIDASTKIVHRMDGTPTKNPIEDGSNVSDHVTLDNKRLIIDGVITKNPITFTQSIQTALTSRVTDAVQGLTDAVPRGIIGTAVGSIGRSLVTSEDRVEDAFKFLEELRDNSVPFRIVTKLKAYDDLLISSLNITQTSRDGNSLRFNMILEQVTIVKTLFEQQTAVKDLDESVRATATKIVERGKQQAKEASTETQRKSTILYKGWNALRD